MTPFRCQFPFPPASTTVLLYLRRLAGAGSGHSILAEMIGLLAVVRLHQEVLDQCFYVSGEKWEQYQQRKELEKSQAGPGEDKPGRTYRMEMLFSGVIEKAFLKQC